MFKDMRRKKQALSEEETLKVLKEGQYGILALLSEDGYPYSLPINYIYEGGHIYFHGSIVGHKLKAIKKHPQASFSVVSKPYQEEGKWWNQYESVICFGTISLMEGEHKLEVLKRIGEKYYPVKEEADETALKTLSRVSVFDFKIVHMTGKHINEK